MPEISIIVPVYKVEKYLRKCIDSILVQTFTDFELILVDDGSPDNCGKICDEYAEKDSRIIVIHKENGGLSSARNAGLDIAKGEYIGFVDSDDYIAADMYETLYSNLVNNNAEVSICGVYACYSDGTVTQNGMSMSALTDSASALQIMLSGVYLDVSAWNKLYKKSIFNDLRYPVGVTCEDMYIIVDIMLKSKSVYIDTSPKYFYLLRANSITNDSSTTNDLNRIKSCKKALELVEKNFPQISAFARCRVYSAYAALIGKLLFFSRDKRKQHRSDIKEAVSAIRGNLFFILKQPHLSRNFKISCLIIFVSPGFFACLKKFYYQHIKKGLAD